MNLIACLPLLLAAAVIQAVETPPVEPAPEPQLPVVAPPSPAEPDPGEALVAERCTACHDMGRIANKHRSEAEWTPVVQRMIEHGAQLTPEQLPQVASYLARAYGPLPAGDAPETPPLDAAAPEPQ